jgi:hypothetical protein
MGAAYPIDGNPVLSNSEFVPKLPASWGTLYARKDPNGPGGPHVVWVLGRGEILAGCRAAASIKDIQDSQKPVLIV